MTSDPPLLGVEDLVVATISSERSLEIGHQLIDTRQRLVAIIRDLIAADDRENLSTLCLDVRAGHMMLRDIAPSQARVSPPGRAPYRKGEPAPVHAARALASLGLALVDQNEHASSHLQVFREWTAHSGVAIAGTTVTVVPGELHTKHTPAIRHLAEAGDLDLLSLIWLADLDGWTRPKRVLRKGPSVQVLFDLGPEGRRATLRLASLTGTSRLNGLVPDPATMALSSADERFRSSLTAAWEVAGGPSLGAVLWSLTDQAGPVTRVTGESLSLAFAVLFDEQRRLGKPVSGPLTVRRLRSRTAIVGRIDPKLPDQASSVSAYDTKLSAVDATMRVVFPQTDRDAAEDANRQNGGGAQLCPVPTWRRAAKTARLVDRRRLLVLATVCLLVVASTVFALYRYSESQRDEDRARLAATGLTTKAVILQKTDPALSAKLALTAHYIDPANAQAVDALRGVLEGNRNVVRTWQADLSRVDSIAVSEQANRILTSGSEGVTKVWTLSPTVLLGELPHHSSQLVTARVQPMAAAVVENDVALYDIRPGKPVDLGYLPKPTCTTTGNIATVRFVNDDKTLVVVWKDGVVAAYDVAAKAQRTCVAWPEVVAPLRVNRSLPTEKVVAADVVDSLDAESGDAEVVFLMQTNDVVATRLSTRDARVEVAGSAVSGAASLVAASREVIAVATAQGVAIWNRKDRAWVANPAGGIGVRPRVIQVSDGYLLFSGDTGTALLRASTPQRQMPETLNAPSGGSATVAAISERNIVAGGPGGRISVIADSSGELALPQDITTTAIAFLPDGRFVAADTPTDFGDASSRDMASSGLVMIDPKATWFPDVAKTAWTPADESSQMYIESVAVRPNLVAAAGQIHGKASVLVWPWDSHSSPKELVLQPPGETGIPADQRTIDTVQFTPDGSAVVARHRTGQIGIWSTDDWSRRAIIDLPARYPSMAVYSGHVVVAAGYDLNTELIEVDLASAQVVRRTPAPRTGFIAATSDGSRLVTLTTDGAIQLFGPDLTRLGDAWHPSPSGDPIVDIAIDNAGRRLALAQGGRVLVYDLDTKTLAMPPLEARGGTVTSVSWSQDGQLLSGTLTPSVSGGRSVTRPTVWKTGELDWTTQVCRWAGSSLTPSEWSHYVSNDFEFTDLCAGIS